MKPRKDSSWPKPDLLLQYAIVLCVFAIYAGSLQLVAVHDDVVNLDAISHRSLLQLFDLRPYGTGYYRPMSFVPWVITRDLFGWYQPTVLYAWNLSCEILNIALIAALASRLGRLFGIRSRVLPVAVALIFGLFPFNYQPVLWAGALPHPLAAFFGLLALHAFLTCRLKSAAHLSAIQKAFWVALSIILLAGSFLSAEEGYAFGLFMLLIEAVNVLRHRQRPQLAVLLPAGLALIYVPLYTFFIRPAWMHISGQAPSASVNDVLASLTYQAQGMVYWWIILLRPVIGLPANRQLIVLGLLVTTCLVGLVMLWIKRLWAHGLVGLGWWAVAIVPSLFLLSPDYVLVSPRLLYIASMGVSLFLGAIVASLVLILRRRVLQALLWLMLVPLFLWCASYLSNWVMATSRYSAALRVIDRDTRISAPSARVLLINVPAWETPTVPQFLIGNESLPLFQSNILAAVSGTQRELIVARHDISLRKSEGLSFFYPPIGRPIDDTALREAILKSDLIFKFDQDPPGLRARLIGRIDKRRTETGGLAFFTDNNAQELVDEAHAYRCGDEVRLDLSWSVVKDVHEPVGIFVHGLDAAGQQVVTADRDLLDGYLPLDLVPPAITITETRLIRLPPHAGDVVSFSIGVYTRSQSRRFTATRPDGTHWADDALSLPVEDNPAECRRVE